MKKAVRWYFASTLLMTAQCAFCAGCALTSATLAFGTTSASAYQHTDTQGMVSLSCTGKLGSTVVYTLSLTAGAGAGFNPRTMKSGSNQARYNVYTDSNRNHIWGDGTAGTLTIPGSLSILGGATQSNVPVYGRVFGGQSLSPGVYADSLMVTLSF